MKLNQKQIETKTKIELFSTLFEIDSNWATSIAMVESSLGLKQKSPTGCRGVFHMSTIAMKDIWLLMDKIDDDLADIVCGILFLRLLKKRWKTIEEATNHFCNPNDRDFYLDRVKDYMRSFKN